MARYTSSPLGLQFGSNTVDGIDKIGSYERGLILSASQSSLFTGDSIKFGHKFFDDRKSYADDITINDIVRYSEKIPSMRLNYADFAYLKKLGVYPTNRLIIARRFLSPVDDDLTAVNSTNLSNSEMVPMSTLISWVDDNKDFFKVSYGEEWEDIEEASFQKVLNEIGGDILMGDNRGGQLGNAAAGAFSAVALPGWTEGLQYRIFKSLGMTDLSPFEHPYGNPNLIRNAKRRRTLSKGSASSGLKATIEVEMEVEYEQKFINGVDPTSVYYDIIANALTFGTSESKFQFRGDKVNKFSRFLDNLGSGNPDRVKLALSTFIESIRTSIRGIGLKLKQLQVNERNERDAAAAAAKANSENVTKNRVESTILGVYDAAVNLLERVALDVISGLVGKYKVKIIGIVNALTGTPSTPWHVTIGNPKRPIFSSGDMVVDNITITMGKLLAFNDLPSSIKISFSLKNARPLGAQEIYKKLNCGHERTYTKVRKSFIESDISWKKGDVTQAEKDVRSNLAFSATDNKDEITNRAKDAYADFPGILVNGQSAPVKSDDGFDSIVVLNNFQINTKNGSKSVKAQFYPNGRVLFSENGKEISKGTYERKVDDKGKSIGDTLVKFDKGFAEDVTIKSDGSI